MFKDSIDGRVASLTSKYHSLTGSEWVMASQLRWTSKSVDLLEQTVSEEDVFMIDAY